MVANISFQNGQAEAFTALTPAWWDSEKEYMSETYLTSEEVWGDRGILNFEYELRELQDAQTGEPIPDYRHCIRKDNGVTVGCGMTDRYKIVQPRQAFDFMDDLMRDGIMKYASAGVLGKGEEIWILGVLPDSEQPISGETHNRYVLFTDRFDGCGSLKAFPCMTRVECSNTLALALRECDESIFQGIRHTGDMQEKLNMAREALLQAETSFQQYNADCSKLIAAQFSKQDAQDYVEQLIPSPVEDAPTRTQNIYQRKIQSVRDAFKHPTSQIGDMKGTYWQLVNAMSFAIDHGNVFQFRGSQQQSTKFKSLMTGDAAKLKAKAFDLALEMAS